MNPALRFLFALLIALSIAPPAVAIMADPRPFEHIQPDGTKIMLRMRGDEYYHFYQDMDGFTVLRQGEQFVYAQLTAEGNLIPTDLPVGRTDPMAAGLIPGLLPAMPRVRPAEKPYRPWATSAELKAAPSIPAAGTVKNLVILCKFKDHTFAAQTRPRADYDTLFNTAGGDPVLAPTGSVRDAYLENSYGIVTVNSTVVAWVTLPQDEAYYAGTNNGLYPSVYPNNAQKMVEDALALVDSLVDFGQFDTADNDGYIDAIDIIHSGYGAENGGAPPSTIWSHQGGLPADWVSADNNANGVKVKVNPYHTEPALWGLSGTGILHIGVICHETGHFFGLPDLYDTDYTSSGIGDWCMMADSWGFDGDQLRPPHFSAWCKAFLGWVTPSVITSAGTFSVAQAETAQSIYKITQGFPAGEYLLVENRQPVGLDSRIPRGGLAVWHVDENVPNNTQEGYPGQVGWPGSGKHFKVALLQADGNYDLERNTNGGDAGDLYQPLNATTLGINTVPNTDSYPLGLVHPTSNRITQVSAAGANMNFAYSFYTSVRYVDKYYLGNTSTGSYTAPYKTVTSAYNAALNGDTILIRGADYDEVFPSGMNKQITIDNWRLSGSTVLR